MIEYFSHDYYSRNDPKMIALRIEMGWEGVGIYWALIEQLYEKGGFIEEKELPKYAFLMRAECDRIKDVLTKYDLFYISDGNYRSTGVDKRFNIRKLKSKQSKEAAIERWKQQRERELNATALLPQSDSNAKEIKENKTILTDRFSCHDSSSPDEFPFENKDVMSANAKQAPKERPKKNLKNSVAAGAAQPIAEEEEDRPF